MTKQKEMNFIKISIIIPVFNTSKYLNKCIQSVIDQSLKEMEIILINDGSTDESKRIIQSFAEKDKRVFFIDGKNEGVSAARNKGIDVAQGEFVGFIDSDDWVEPKMFETLFLKAKEADADLAICNLVLKEEGKNKVIRLDLENKISDINSNRTKELVNLMRFKYDFGNCNKIYSAHIIKHNKLLFAENMKVYEDLLFNLCYFQYSQKAIIVNEAMYHYRIHPDSVMNVSKHDVVTEYNLLFSGFNTFCISQNLREGVEKCNEEMRRGFYFAVLPQLYKQIKTRERSLRKRIKSLNLELEKVEKGLFDYTSSELKGLQGLKKDLLKKGRFRRFSFLKFIN